MSVPSSAKARWLAVWPGVAIASQAVARAFDHVAIRKRDIGQEIEVGAGVEFEVLAGSQRTRRAVRARRRGSARRSRARSRRRRRRMVAMRVGNEDMRDPRAADRLDDGIDMLSDRPVRGRGPPALSAPIRKVFVPRKVKGPAFGAVTRRIRWSDLDRLAGAAARNRGRTASAMRLVCCGAEGRCL